jgi:hypothetical protein
MELKETFTLDLNHDVCVWKHEGFQMHVWTFFLILLHLFLYVQFIFDSLNKFLNFIFFLELLPWTHRSDFILIDDWEGFIAFLKLKIFLINVSVESLMAEVSKLLLWCEFRGDNVREVFYDFFFDSIACSIGRIHRDGFSVWRLMNTNWMNDCWTVFDSLRLSRLRGSSGGFQYRRRASLRALNMLSHCQLSSHREKIPCFRESLTWTISLRLFQ